MLHMVVVFIMSLIISTVALFEPPSAIAQQRDVAGSRDFPGIGRFRGSTITGYDVKDFDATRLQAGPFRDGAPTDARRLEGRVTRIAYLVPRGPSMLEVSRNFEQQLTGAGYTTLLLCDADACGGIPFTEAIDTLPIPLMWVDGFAFRYLSARKVDGDRETYVSVLVSRTANEEITAQVTVAQIGGMENRMVNAAAMARGLGDRGHIALYGIYFDTDRAVIKPESRPTLDEIAKLLTENPRLNVIIVGHTDIQGGFDHNMTLSRRRAEAVAADLVQTYRIARPRLQTAGVGYLAPVGSNATEEGRALNRRVELVAR